MPRETDLVIAYGALRSGTTLFRLMLNNHPDLNCPGEADYLFDFLTRGSKGEWHINRDAMSRNRIFQASGLQYPDGLPAKETVENLIAQLRAQTDAKCLVLMIHRELSTALELFPKTSVIHFLRDPRDVARSSIGMGWAGDVYHGVGHWIETETGWEQAVSRLSPGQYTQLHYEKLIRDPKAELGRIAAFLEVPYDPDMLRYSENSTYSAPDPNLTEQWRKKLSPYEVGLVEGRIGPLLENAGYAPSGYPAQTPGGIQIFSLKLGNKTKVWQERIRRFGLVDTLLVALASRLKTPKLG